MPPSGRPITRLRPRFPLHLPRRLLGSTSRPEGVSLHVYLSLEGQGCGRTRLGAKGVDRGGTSDLRTNWTTPTRPRHPSTHRAEHRCRTRHQTTPHRHGLNHSCGTRRGRPHRPPVVGGHRPCSGTCFVEISCSCPEVRERSERETGGEYVFPLWGRREGPQGDCGRREGPQGGVAGRLGP